MYIGQLKSAKANLSSPYFFGSKIYKYYCYFRLV